jgi:hypothetical protein
MPWRAGDCGRYHQCYSCLKDSKSEVHKMLDYVSKSAIDFLEWHVSIQARNIASRPKLPVSIYCGVIKIEGNCRLSLQTSYTQFVSQHSDHIEYFIYWL